MQVASASIVIHGLTSNHLPMAVAMLALGLQTEPRQIEVQGAGVVTEGTAASFKTYKAV